MKSHERSEMSHGRRGDLALVAEPELSLSLSLLSPAPARSDPSSSDPGGVSWPWPWPQPCLGDFMELSALCSAPFPSCLSS